MRCRGSFAILEGHAYRRTRDLLSDIRLGGGDVRRQYRETAWRIEIRYFAFRQKTLAVQQFLQTLAQFQRRGIDHSRGNLFATDLQQEIWHLFLFAKALFAAQHPVLLSGVGPLACERSNGVEGSLVPAVCLE